MIKEKILFAFKLLGSALAESEDQVDKTKTGTDKMRDVIRQAEDFATRVKTEIAEAKELVEAARAGAEGYVAERNTATDARPL